MAKADFSQVRTLSERFGFRDSDLTTTRDFSNSLNLKAS